MIFQPPRNVQMITWLVSTDTHCR